MYVSELHPYQISYSITQPWFFRCNHQTETYVCTLCDGQNGGSFPQNLTHMKSCILSLYSYTKLKTQCNNFLILYLFRFKHYGDSWYESAYSSSLAAYVVLADIGTLTSYNDRESVPRT
jgi:hypothetical protein